MAVVSINAVDTGGDFELVGPDASIDLHGACEDVGVVTALGVEALAIDADLPLIDLVATQSAIAEDGVAGGERGSGGIEEGGTIDVDARRVGDDDVGTVAGDFDVAA